MFHHGPGSYREAASEAAKVARVKLDETIQKGIQGATQVIERIQSKVIQDRVIKTANARVELLDGRFALRTGELLEPIHKHAFGQVIADAGIPKKYADELETQANGTRWGAELVAHNINTVLSHRDKQRNLVRSEGQEVRGFVSDKFRRLDSRPLLESFVTAAAATGLVPLDAWATDTKVRVRAILPKVFEPIDNEVMAFGLEWGNSDFGDGGHCVSLYVLRMWCTNLAIGDQVLRQVHLGKRLADDITYSEQTYRLDTQATASALKDTVRHAIGPATIGALCESIQKATQSEITSRDGVLKRLKNVVSQNEAEKIADAFESPDVVNLPPGQTDWRLSNVFSWLAQSKDFSTEKRLEYQKIAGDILPGTKMKARTV